MPSRFAEQEEGSATHCQKSSGCAERVQDGITLVLVPTSPKSQIERVTAVTNGHGIEEVELETQLSVTTGASALVAPEHRRRKSGKNGTTRRAHLRDDRGALVTTTVGTAANTFCRTCGAVPPILFDNAAWCMLCAVARFWARVDSSAEGACWPWTGRVNGDGYGHHRLLGEQLAHRIAWRLAHGRAPVPAGLQMMHLCDNPPCCNPAHLKPGTNADNQAHAVAFGDRRPRPTCRRGHPRVEHGRLTASGAYACRVCTNERRRQVRAQRRSSAR
jgi:hypothetical protein